MRRCACLTILLATLGVAMGLCGHRLEQVARANMLLAGVAAGAPQWTLLSHTAKAGSGSGSSFTTTAIDTTGADLLVAVVSTATSFSDNKSNSWTIGAADSSNYTKLEWSKPTSVGTGHTISVTVQYGPVVFAAFKKSAATAPNDQTNASLTTTPGSITTVANALVVTACQNNAGTASSISGGFAIVENLTYNASVNYGMAFAWLGPSSGAVSPTWTVSGVMASSIMSFKPG